MGVHGLIKSSPGHHLTGLIGWRRGGFGRLKSEKPIFPPHDVEILNDTYYEYNHHPIPWIYLWTWINIYRDFCLQDLKIPSHKISSKGPRIWQKSNKNPRKTHPIACFSTLLKGRCTRLPERRRTRTSDVGQQRWLQGGKTPVDDGESLIGYPLVISHSGKWTIGPLENFYQKWLDFQFANSELTRG